MATQRLVIPCKLTHIHKISDLVGEAAHSAGFDQRTSYECQLAAAEACENIIIHGYGRDACEGEIEVLIKASSGSLTIQLVDTAPQFDPSQSTNRRPPQAESPPDGGFGLLILHRIMDDVRYERKGEKNILTFTKREHYTEPKSP